MAYYKDARGGWPQPAGVAPSWRGWPQGIIGPSPGYRVSALSRLSGCGACGGLAAEDDPYEPLPPPPEDEPWPVPPEDTAVVEATKVAKAAEMAAAGRSSSGAIVLVGVAALGLLLLLR